MPTKKGPPERFQQSATAICRLTFQTAPAAPPRKSVDLCPFEMPTRMILSHSFLFLEQVDNDTQGNQTNESVLAQST